MVNSRNARRTRRAVARNLGIGSRRAAFIARALSRPLGEGETRWTVAWNATESVGLTPDTWASSTDDGDDVMGITVSGGRKQWSTWDVFSPAWEDLGY